MNIPTIGLKFKIHDFGGPPLLVECLQCEAHAKFLLQPPGIAHCPVCRASYQLHHFYWNADHLDQTEIALVAMPPPSTQKGS